MTTFRTNCVLLVIDVQEKLIDTIAKKMELVKSIKALARMAKILDIPILW